MRAIGTRHAVAPERAARRAELPTITIAMTRAGGPTVRGTGAHVLGGPLSALRFLVEEQARHAGSAPLEAGEFVTTGTLTAAMPVRPGEIWRTRLAGTRMRGLRLSFR